MEKMPLLFLILYSIPESIAMTSLGGSLYGYDIRKNFKKIVTLSILLATVTLLARYLPFGQNILFELPIFIVLTAVILRTSLKISSFIIVTTLVVNLLTMNIYFSLIPMLTNLAIPDILNSTWLRLLTGWIYLLLMSVLTLLIIKKNFTFTKAFGFFKNTTTNTKISLLIFIVLAQAFLAGVLQMASIFEEHQGFPIAFDNLVLQRLIGFALVTIPIISIFLLKRVFTLSQQEAIIATQETYLNNINNLFVTIRGQRHDFMNHVQVIYSLLKSNNSEDALKYMDNLLDDIQEVNEVIKTKDPALSALLNTKLAMAERHHIVFATNIEAPIEGLNIKALDLVKILGNLLDNAYEAVLNQPANLKNVKLSIKSYGNVIVFEVFNPSPVIPPEHLDTIFDGGFSTKRAEGHSGLGLAVVKEIVEKYDGQFGVKSNEAEGTTFTVAIPK